MIIVIALQHNTRTIGGQQFYLCRNAPVVAQEDVIIVVYAELFVSQHGVLPENVGTNTAAFHFGRHAEVDAQLLIDIVKTSRKRCASLRHLPAKKSIEHILRIVLSVTYLARIGNLVVGRSHIKPDSIEAHAVCYERIDLQLAIDTGNRRRGHVYQSAFQCKFVPI